MPDDAATAAPYVAAFAGLTAETLPALLRLVAPDVHFRDPLYEGHGVDALERALRAVVTALDDPRFAIGTVAAADGTVFVSWTMTFRRKGKRGEWRIEGISDLRFDAQGRVARHLNHWDAAGQLYEHVPVLGSLMRTIRRQVVADTRADP